MLGSLTLYRRFLYDTFFSPYLIPTPDRTLLALPENRAGQGDLANLPPIGHGLAGILAGWTVSFVATPVEHIKARLQIQYAADRRLRLYSGPVDCLKKIVSAKPEIIIRQLTLFQFSAHGVSGVYQGHKSNLIFRTFFFFWWSSYDIFSRILSVKTKLSEPAINFWAGGMSAQIFWITSFPADVIKQRTMTDGLGDERRFKTWRATAAQIYRERGLTGFYR
jgi:solute carrier family 25 carnitine/acylcarnitine transporter 20/29